MARSVTAQKHFCQKKKKKTKHLEIYSLVGSANAKVSIWFHNVFSSCTFIKQQAKIILNRMFNLSGGDTTWNFLYNLENQFELQDSLIRHFYI